VIKAQGGYLKDTQQAYLMREDVKRAQLQNRRAAYEEWLWERANLPTLEDERQRTAKEQVRRAQNDPPHTEIWSALALNTLLNHSQTMSASNKGALPNIPLDPDVLSKINLNTGKGNWGVIKNDGKVEFPPAIKNLVGNDAAATRQTAAALIKNAYDKVKQGGSP